MLAAEVYHNLTAYVNRLARRLLKIDKLDSKAKCLDYSLHFILCSWHPEQHNTSSLHCPEYSQHQGRFMVWSQRTLVFVVEAVLGDASPHTVA